MNLRKNNNKTEANKNLLFKIQFLEEQLISLKSDYNGLENKYKNQISHELRYLKETQEYNLKHSKILFKKFEDSFILNKPRDIHSGDFVLSELIDDKFLIFLGDCSDFGIETGWNVNIAFKIFYYLIQKEKKVLFSDPNYFMELFSREFTSATINIFDYKYPSIDISLTIIDPKKQQLQFSSIKQKLYIIRSRRIVEIKADRAIKEQNSIKYLSFNSRTHELLKGDQIYLASDGLSRQFGGVKNRPFNRKRLKQILLKNNSEKMSKQKEFLEKTLKDWMLGGHNKRGYWQLDDILLIGIKI